MDSCPDCGCTSFEPHLFKKTICRICMHPHSSGSVVISKSSLPSTIGSHSTLVAQLAPPSRISPRRSHLDTSSGSTSTSSAPSSTSQTILTRGRPSPSLPAPYDPNYKADEVNNSSSSPSNQGSVKRPMKIPSKPPNVSASNTVKPRDLPSLQSQQKKLANEFHSSSNHHISTILSSSSSSTSTSPSSYSSHGSSNPLAVPNTPSPTLLPLSPPTSQSNFRPGGSIISLPPSSRTAMRRNHRGAMTLKETPSVNLQNLNQNKDQTLLSPKSSFSLTNIRDDLSEDFLLRWDIEPPSTEKVSEILHCLLLSLELDSENIEKIRKIIESRKKKTPNPTILIPQLKKVAKKSTDIVNGQKDIETVTLIQSYIRFFLCRRRYLRIQRDFTEDSYKRLVLFRELYKKESRYLTNLRHIVDDYLGPLTKSPSSGKTGLGQKEILAIFGNIQNVLEVHNTFFHKLDKLKDINWPFISDLGYLFAQTLPQYQCYGPYVHNFKFAMDTLDVLESKDKGMALLDECTNRFDKSGASSLRMLLSQPLNHINSYELILEEYISLTPPEEKDHLELLQVVEVIRETSSYIRESLAQADNKANFLSIQSRLKKFDGELYQPKREYITEGGRGMVLYEGSKKQGPAFLFIFSDIMVVAKTLSKGYEFKYLVYFRDVEAKDTNDSTNESLVSCGLELSDPQQSFQLCFADPGEKANWASLIRRLISENQVNRVFGVPLEELYQKGTDKLTKDRDYLIPTVVFKLIEYIRLNAMDIEGIFRVSGNASKISAIKQAFDKGTTPDYNSLSPHDIASALKLYFRELPEPLLTYRLYSRLLEIMDSAGKDKKSVTKQVLKEIKTIPEANLKILKYVLIFLNEVSKHEKNMMKEENLSICWGPTVFRPKEETIDYPLQVPKINYAFQIFLENTKKIE